MQIGRSKISYYNGVSQNIQRGDQGTYGLAYVLNFITADTLNIVNQMVCFVMNGSQGNTVTPQPVLPDVSNFYYLDSEIIGGRVCQAWENTTSAGSKVSTYTMWVTDDDLQTPVRYEMFGYDSLFGSHFDKYIIDYTEFNNLNEPDDSAYAIPQNLQPCVSFPGAETGITAEMATQFNPMREFIHGDESNYQEKFEKFKHKHNVKYEMKSVKKIGEIFLRTTLGV